MDNTKGIKIVILLAILIALSILVSLFGIENITGLSVGIENEDYTNIYYSYDILGNLESSKDPLERTSIYKRDTIGRLIMMNKPDTGVTSYEYYDNSLVKSITNADNSIIYHEYDALKRLKRRYSNTLDVNENFYYDNNPNCNLKENSMGRLCEVDDNSGTTLITYDKRGRITSETKDFDKNLDTEEDKFTISYTYDNAGNVKEILTPDNKRIIQNYNSISQVESIQLDIDNDGIIDSTLAENIIYTPYSLMENVELGNNLNIGYRYYPRRWMEEITYSGPSGTYLDESYEYDNAGNIKKISNDLTGSSYLNLEYDKLNRLTDVYDTNYLSSDIHYTYDKAGNRKIKESGGNPRVNYIYNDIASSNKLKSDEDYSYTYDQAGRVKTLSDDEGTSTYYYDSLGRLSIVELPNGDYTAYIYNFRGERSIKFISRGANVISKIYIYDQNGDLMYEKIIEGLTPPTPPCTESWTCTAWGPCIRNTQTRTCTDSNNCGTILNKPAETQVCGVGGI